ncbi:MAG: SDR family oxidoreductase [Pseudomonadota bacterium]
MKTVILGCGDVGKRIARALIQTGVDSSDIIAYVSSSTSEQACGALGLDARFWNLDQLDVDLADCHGAHVYYTVAPQKEGESDQRTANLMQQWRAADIRPEKILLLSTTGVYGDQQGELVTEETPLNPSTPRAKRRFSAEQQWRQYGNEKDVPVVVFRVPGIYARSRLPEKRVRSRQPVVKPEECGYTNRIHANDLARACVLALEKCGSSETFNICDGNPDKVSNYLQAVTAFFELPPLPEISLLEAQDVLSEGMLSYLSESRKIDNSKILNKLGFKLEFDDYRRGIAV